MIAESIRDQIKSTDIESIKKMLGDMPYEPYPYQFAAFRVTAEEIRKKDPVPVVVKAAVSAGKTTMISMACRRIMLMNRLAGKDPRNQHQALVISRQGEIVSQDAEEIWNFGVENSIFCAGLKRKSVNYPIVVGSEKTVVNALGPGGKLSEEKFTPLFLFIDECQHVNVDDYCDSETSGKGKRTMYQVEETIDDMKEAGRTGYTIIIRELQRRCRLKYGKELRIIGYTGTDYRGVQPIINPDMKTPGLWRKAICDISTEFLVEFGAVVPTTFGIVADDLKYDLNEFHSDGNDGDGEYSDEDLKAMQAKILASGTTTQKIMVNVHEIAKSRNCVLVTCAGKAHCAEAAAALPPGVTWGIVTDDTPQAERMRLLDDAFHGRCKYIFQIGCLTTGINIPPWDTIVILRRIGSLTLLTQLIGRGMRLLKDMHKHKLGMVKKDNLVLDYAGALDDLADLYHSPMLEKYQFDLDTASSEFKTCPKCQTQNGEHARRCRHVDEVTGERCEYFWVSRICGEELDAHGLPIPGCGAENDIVARYCRCCGAQLIDPNKKLDRTHYTEDDFIPVLSFKVETTKDGGGIVFAYQLRANDDRTIKAYEVFWPNSESRGAWAEWSKALDKHVHDPEERSKLRNEKSIGGILSKAALFQAPKMVTHRKINNGKKDVISRKRFGDLDPLAEMQFTNQTEVFWNGTQN